MKDQFHISRTLSLLESHSRRCLLHSERGKSTHWCRYSSVGYLFSRRGRLSKSKCLILVTNISKKRRRKSTMMLLEPIQPSTTKEWCSPKFLLWLEQLLRYQKNQRLPQFNNIQKQLNKSQCNQIQLGHLLIILSILLDIKISLYKIIKMLISQYNLIKQVRWWIQMQNFKEDYLEVLKLQNHNSNHK